MGNGCTIERGNELLQQLHALRDHILDIDRHSGDVAAGVSQTLNPPISTGA